MFLLETLDYPKINRRRIAIAELEDRLEADSEEKRLIKSNISSIELYSVLGGDSCMIRSYSDDDVSYQAIYILRVIYKKTDEIDKVTRLINKIFMEPVIIFFQNKIQGVLTQPKEFMGLTIKRKNKVESNKMVIEDVITGNISEYDYPYFNIKDSSVKNLMELYFEVINNLYYVTARNIINQENINKSKCKEFVEKYQLLSKEKKKKQELYKSAAVASEQIKIDNDIYNIDKQIKELIENIKE